MFGSLTEKFQDLALKLSGNKSLSEGNIADAVRTVRLALLDADVSYSIVSSFIKRVKESAIGVEKTKGITAGDQFIKIVHEELVDLMGTEESKLNLKPNPTKILLCGLQGSGKTTHAAKIALMLKKKFHKKPLLIALDLQRPAAIEQLRVLASQIEVDLFCRLDEKNPKKIAKEALKKEGYDVFIFDTAGRLHIDDSLMKELEGLKKEINPHEILFVANSSGGQDAVKVAQDFDNQIGITGSILTMLDGSSRAGAALSIREITKKPLLFEGVGEKVEDLQIFNPISMADRILGMGDVINLAKKAEEQFSEEENKKLEQKFLKASFTFDDYLTQMSRIKKMGPLKGLLKMMPNMGDMINLDDSEKDFVRTEAIILSMTPDERSGKVDLVPTRKKRIAKGSGTSMGDVNRLVKGFKQLKKMAKQMPGLKRKFKNEDSFRDLAKKISAK